MIPRRERGERSWTMVHAKAEGCAEGRGIWRWVRARGCEAGMGAHRDDVRADILPERDELLAELGELGQALLELPGRQLGYGLCAAFADAEPGLGGRLHRMQGFPP